MPNVSDVYKRLYHYTTPEGLEGILETQSLWATHCKFLNDLSEITLYKEILPNSLIKPFSDDLKRFVQGKSDFLKRVAALGGIDAVVRHDTHGIVSALYDALGDEIYVASFCGEHPDDQYTNENGLLSQWRGYGANGGFAIVFKTLELEKMVGTELEKFDYGPRTMADVVYSGDKVKFDSDLVQPLSKIVEYARKIFLSIMDDKGKMPDAAEALPAFFECICRYKHRGFREENEVRIALIPVAHDEKYLELAKKADAQKLRPEKERKFRRQGHEQVPYIELFGFKDMVLPIEKIIVGPHRQKEARASALRVMLNKTDIEVTVSDIPYIGR